MFALPKRASLIAPLVVSGLLIAFVVTACGDDDDTIAAETPVAATQQDGAGADAGSGSEETPGGDGTAIVAVSAGTFELQLEGACVISDIGIGAVASSDEASLSIAGPQEIAVVGFELSSGDAWFAAAANVEIDGTTMSYTGPAMNPDESGSTISVQVFCGETVTGPGG